MLSSKYCRPKILSLAISVIAAGAVSTSYGQQNSDAIEEIEEVMVTGSYIKSSPGDEPVPVQVMSRDDLDAIGVTTVSDIISKLAISSGSENQSDSFTQGSTQGTANVNLRGLGLSSTLVLVNGRRQTISGALTNDGSVFVDTSTIPAMAVERVEILKEGAASTYGSDAIAGVVNFILRKDYEGLEINLGSQETKVGSQRDQDAGFLWGWGNDSVHVILSGSILDRTPLSVSEKPELADRAISSLGTSFLTVAPTTVADGPYAGSYGAFENVPLAGCTETDGGVIIPQPSGSRCGFHYGPRFNLVNSEHRRQLYGNLTANLGDDTELMVEAGWSNNNVEDNPQSPSYPYLSFPVVMPTHPGSPFDIPVVWLGRPLGAGYPSPKSPRENDTFRTSVDLTGSFNNGWSWNTALTYSKNEFRQVQPDTIQSRLNAGLAGTGGVNGDEFFDPFDPSQNSQSLIDWMSYNTDTQRTTDLLVLDGVVSGELFEMSGGTVGFAAGIQFRDEGYQVETDDIYEIKFDADGNPIPVDLIFLGGVSEVNTSRKGYAIFAESKFPISEDLELTAALRYEKLDNDNTVDPKLAMRWKLSEKIVLRASASTAFREPSLSQLNATAVSLQGIQDFNADGSKKGGVAFIRVASQGSQDLTPEESTNYNVGAIVTATDDLELKLDFWRVDYSDLITQESAQGLIVRDLNGENVVRTPAGQLIGINTRYFNSSNVKVDGLDLEVDWNISDSITMRANMSHFLRYDLTLTDGSTIEAAGSFNHDNFARSLPETKANVMFNWGTENQTAAVILNWVSDYETSRAVPAGSSQKINSFTTVDAQYRYLMPLNFSDGSEASITVGVKNLFDREPPRVYDAANYSYDPKQHSPLGRQIYIKTKIKFY